MATFWTRTPIRGQRRLHGANRRRAVLVVAFVSVSVVLSVALVVAVANLR